MKRVFWLCLVWVLFSCDEDKFNNSDQGTIRPLKTEEKYLVEASNNFAIEVLKKLESNASEQAVFSPLGLGMTAGILSNAVEEVNYKMLGTHELNSIEVNKAFYEVENMLPRLDEKVKINFANALWNKEAITLSEDFTSKVMAYYNADVRALDFEKDQAQNYITKWAEVKTEQRLTSVDVSQNQEDLYLINAASFTYPHHLSNTTIDATIVSADLHNIYTFEDQDILFKEYVMGNKRYSLVTMEPKNGQNIGTLIRKLTPSDLRHYRDNVTIDAARHVPDLDITFEHNYVDVFDRQWFTRFLISQSGSNLNALDKFKFNITHKASVRIASPDPEEVSGVDAMQAKSSSFIFFITEPHTDLLLFAGINR